MATNNAINLKTAGIVTYDGAGTFSALSNPLTVSNGGTGVTSMTPFCMWCGGTTSTGAIQSVASTGNTGQILISNGAGALPSFQNASLGMCISVSTSTGNPADATTYFLAQANALTIRTTSGVSFTRYFIPQAGTINTVYGAITVQGTLGSAQNTTMAIRLNNTTDYTISSSIATSSASNAFNTTSLGLSVVAGDYIEFKFTGPTWTTNPTTVAVSVTALLL